MLAAQAVIDAQGPHFEIEENAVHPRQHPSIGLGGRPRCEISRYEGMQAAHRVVGHLGEPDPGVLHLDGANEQLP